MLAAPIPADETARLDALRALEVLDTAPEAEFDALVRAASAVCGTPVSLISLIDADRQWFKANVGLAGVEQTPRDIAFCSHAILGRTLFEVPDACLDARFADNPLVTSPPHIRFYAGAPIITVDGHALGTLCVIDRCARALDDSQREVLRLLARAAGKALEGRAAVSRAQRLGLELARHHELLQTTLRAIGDAVITLDGAGRLTWMNPVAERLTGRETSQSLRRPLADVVALSDPATSKPLESLVAWATAGAGAGSPEPAPGPFRADAVIVSRHGAEFAVEVVAAPIVASDGGRLGAVLVLRDVTEQRRTTREITYRATHDDLTGLMNRTEFEQCVRRSLHRSQGGAAAGGGPGETGAMSGALLFIDLDQFKLVNDTCGHSVGDRLLRQVGQMLVAAVRPGDIVARMGGDEFAVLLHGCAVQGAKQVAQRICDRMDDWRFAHEDRRFRIGASIGLVPLDGRFADAGAAMQAADGCCYAAKQAGRNRVVARDDAQAVVGDRQGDMQWAARIEQALDDDRLVLFGQRIVALQDPAETGLRIEVLLRLVERDGSLVPPGAFLPAAERFHLMGRLDRWVVMRAIGWLHAQPSLDGLLTLSVNLSGQSVGDRAFQRWAIDQLEQAGPEVCRRLCFEITETAAVTNLSDAADFIRQLRDRGVRTALDDFGSGASSFGYLKRLPVDKLKIDGQFVRDVLTDPLDAAAVRCFVDIARVVGLRTVAEFVDSAEVLGAVRGMGVDFAQGFHVHRPQPLSEIGWVRAMV